MSINVFDNILSGTIYLGHIKENIAAVADVLDFP